MHSKRGVRHPPQADDLEVASTSAEPSEAYEEEMEDMNAEQGAQVRQQIHID